MKYLLITLLLSGANVLNSRADDLQITLFNRDGTLVVTNTFTNGVLALEKAWAPDGPWFPVQNAFSITGGSQFTATISNAAGFYRAAAVDLSIGLEGFTNLVNSYDLLTTIAGSGSNTICTPCNNWNVSFEGGPGTAAELSHPHIAMADLAGNIYIADKEAHAIRKLNPAGHIFTVAGINESGNGSTNPSPALTVALNNPNGLWVREDGTFYILDSGNGFIRKVDTNGIMTALADNHGPIPGGRGLWVSPDESILFYSAFSDVRSWDTTNGVQLFVNGFSQLGNLAVNPDGVLYVTDRAGNKVYRIESDGTKTVVAGNGGFAGGGDGQLATDTGLKEVRGIFFLPTGAYFLATDGGSQVWYVDLDGYIHLFVSGTDAFAAHAGDGYWFYDKPTLPKLSKVRQITLDHQGNLLITENDLGFVRKVRFLEHLPD